MDNFNRPAPAVNRAAQYSDDQKNIGNNLSGKRKWLKLPHMSLRKVSAGLVFLVLVASGIYFFYVQPNQLAVNSSEYQAVFLTNGQVYFGKLHQSQNGYLAMSDIYYLQVQEAQPTGSAVKSGTTTSQASTGASNTQLVKLGQELHAPEDNMVISKDQILFWENIKDNGKVVQAINDYKAKK